MSELTVMFVGDLVGRPGRQAAAHLIKPLREKHNVDFCICNVENAAGGFGVTPEMSRKVFSYGADVQTSGNHIWDRVQILDYISDEPRLLRPANYPPTANGRGVWVGEIGETGHKIAVMNLMGRVYMNNIDCPFRVGNREINALPDDVKIVFIDFHAEATSEKQAFAHYVDGKVSVVAGTHTHVPTADAHVTPRGTAYITDVGMTGPYDSVLGMDKGPSLGRFLTGMPKRFTPATDDVRLCAIIVRVSTEDGRALAIERLEVPFNLANVQVDDLVKVDED